MAADTLISAERAYIAACRELRSAEDAAGAAYDRFERNPDLLEYVIDWQVARLHEAEAAARKREARQALLRASGDPRDCEG